MTGAMYSAIAGLRTHMSALNVIGNNISNVNTLGYKATRYTFDEALYTTTRNGSNGTETEGGRNPAQIGYGCSVSTIDLDMSSKNFTPTGVGLDCMIDGDGFFITGEKTQTMRTKSDLQTATLTRLGNIEFHDGYLVDGNGKLIFGYACLGINPDTGEYEYNTALTPLRFPKLEVTPPTEDEPAKYEVLYPEAENGYLTYEGDPYNPDGTVNEDAMDMPVLNTISIDEKTGLIHGITDQGTQLCMIGYIGIAKVDNPNGVTHVDGRYYQALDGAGGVHATIMGGVPNYMQNNEATGDNEEDPPFPVESAGNTKLIPGGLESSGTDLANEVSNMIIIQRGYQANTRIVTVTDSMLEELVNMKR